MYDDIFEAANKNIKIAAVSYDNGEYISTVVFAMKAIGNMETLPLNELNERDDATWSRLYSSATKYYAKAREALQHAIQ